MRTIAALICFCCWTSLISTAGAAQPANGQQQGVKQPSPPAIAGTDVKTPDATKAAANPQPAQTGNTVPEDPSAIPVIKQLTQITDDKATAITAALGQLGDKNKYSAGVHDLIKALNDPAINAAQSDWAGKKGPHLLIHFLDPGNYDATAQAFKGARSKWYIWREGIVSTNTLERAFSLFRGYMCWRLRDRLTMAMLWRR